HPSRPDNFLGSKGYEKHPPLKQSAGKSEIAELLKYGVIQDRLNNLLINNSLIKIQMDLIKICFNWRVE
ncbi:MAG: hypothetical protein ACYC3N_12090, partial [Halothiobacillus sp.]